MNWQDIRVASSFTFEGQEFIKVSSTEYFNPADGNISKAADVFPRLDRFHKSINRTAARVRIPERVEKVLYDAHSYAFNVPPGPTGLWAREDWIKYINGSGYWIYQHLD